LSRRSRGHGVHLIDRIGFLGVGYEFRIASGAASAANGATTGLEARAGGWRGDVSSLQAASTTNATANRIALIVG